MSEVLTLFYSGPFSQWYPSRFEIDNIVYNTAEQYMMAEKAKLFGDDTIRQQILKSNNPREQKRLGRLVRGFDEAVWNQHCIDIVHRATWAKFSQNPGLLMALLAAPGTLVEASPYDIIWGIGLSEADPRAMDRAQWRGTNWLGEVLTVVRDEFLKIVEPVGFSSNPNDYILAIGQHIDKTV